MADEPEKFDLDEPKAPQMGEEAGARPRAAIPMTRSSTTRTTRRELNALYLELAKLQDHQQKAGTPHR